MKYSDSCTESYDIESVIEDSYDTFMANGVVPSLDNVVNDILENYPILPTGYNKSADGVNRLRSAILAQYPGIDQDFGGSAFESHNYPHFVTFAVESLIDGSKSYDYELYDDEPHFSKYSSDPTITIDISYDGDFDSEQDCTYFDDFCQRNNLLASNLPTPASKMAYSDDEVNDFLNADLASTEAVGAAYEGPVIDALKKGASKIKEGFKKVGDYLKADSEGKQQMREENKQAQIEKKANKDARRGTSATTGQLESLWEVNNKAVQAFLGAEKLPTELPDPKLSDAEAAKAIILLDTILTASTPSVYVLIAAPSDKKILTAVVEDVAKSVDIDKVVDNRQKLFNGLADEEEKKLLQGSQAIVISNIRAELSRHKGGKIIGYTNDEAVAKEFQQIFVSGGSTRLETVDASNTSQLEEISANWEKFDASERMRIITKILGDKANLFNANVRTALANQRRPFASDNLIWATIKHHLNGPYTTEFKFDILKLMSSNYQFRRAFAGENGYLMLDGLDFGDTTQFATIQLAIKADSTLEWHPSSRETKNGSFLVALHPDGQWISVEESRKAYGTLNDLLSGTIEIKEGQDYGIFGKLTKTGSYGARDVGGPTVGVSNVVKQLQSDIANEADPGKKKELLLDFMRTEYAKLREKSDQKIVTNLAIDLGINISIGG